MNKLFLPNPPDKAWHKATDSKIEFGAYRYDGDFLTFQIIFFLIPCLASSYLIIDAEEDIFIKAIIYIAILASIIFWIVSNFKNKIIFEIENERMTVKKGYPLSQWFSVDMNIIEGVYIKKKYGRARYSWNSGSRTEVLDLIICLNDGEELNMGSFNQNRHKHYFKLVIEFYLRENAEKPSKI